MFERDLTIHHVCGVDELADAPLADADRIVSILEPGAPSPRELEGLDKPILTLRFDDATTPGRGVVAPSEQHIRELLAFDADAGPGDRLVVHCTAGISRSTAALAILLAARHPGDEDAVFASIREIRPRAWPNARMVAIGDALLARGGALTEALLRHREIQMQRYPELFGLIP